MNSYKLAVATQFLHSFYTAVETGVEDKSLLPGQPSNNNEDENDDDETGGDEDGDRTVGQLSNDDTSSQTSKRTSKRIEARKAKKRRGVATGQQPTKSKKGRQSENNDLGAIFADNVSQKEQSKTKKKGKKTK